MSQICFYGWFLYLNMNLTGQEQAPVSFVKIFERCPYEFELDDTNTVFVTYIVAELWWNFVAFWGHCLRVSGSDFVPYATMKRMKISSKLPVVIPSLLP